MDKQREEFLIKLTKKYYNQGDSYYAYKTKKGDWCFGYSNDYPLQHGPGKNVMLPEQMVDILINKCFTL